MVRAMKDVAEAMTDLDPGDDEGIDTHLQKDCRRRRLPGRPNTTTPGSTGPAARKPASRSRGAIGRAVRVRHLSQVRPSQHPDRETDAQQYNVKTTLIQKANQAYAAKDLLALPERQLQIEQIDTSHIASA